jgi:hypothetical protein
MTRLRTINEKLITALLFKAAIASQVCRRKSYLPQIRSPKYFHGPFFSTILQTDQTPDKVGVNFLAGFPPELSASLILGLIALWQDKFMKITKKR